MLSAANQNIVEFVNLEDLLLFNNKTPVTLTIGSFDAIHLGHQKLISETVGLAKKNNTIPALLTFNSHPRKILNSEKSGASIFSYEHRLELILKLGIQKIFVIHFNERFSNLSPFDFIQKILIESLCSKAIITGEDFCFGKNRQAPFCDADARRLAKSISSDRWAHDAPAPRNLASSPSAASMAPSSAAVNSGSRGKSAGQSIRAASSAKRSARSATILG